MNGRSIITRMLGGTMGAASSEARFSLLGLIAGVVQIALGDMVGGIETIRLVVVAYLGARALPKTGQAVGDAVRAYVSEREAARNRVEVP